MNFEWSKLKWNTARQAILDMNHVVDPNEGGDISLITHDYEQYYNKQGEINARDVADVFFRAYRKDKKIFEVKRK